MRDGSRINAPASPRQQWVVEMWINGTYEGYEMFATHEQAQAFADNYDAMLKEFREATQ